MTALAGKWTYRRFHNNPSPVTDNAETALGLFFAEANVTLADAPNDTLIAGYPCGPRQGRQLWGTTRCHKPVALGGARSHRFTALVFKSPRGISFPEAFGADIDI